MRNREKALITILVLLSVLATLYFRQGVMIPAHFDEWINYDKTVKVLEGDLYFTRQAARGLAGVARSEVGLSLFLATLSKTVGVMQTFALMPVILNVLIVLLFYAIGRKFGFGLEAGLMALVLPCTPYLLGLKYTVALSFSLVLFFLCVAFYFYAGVIKAVPFVFLFLLLNLFVHPAIAVLHFIFWCSMIFEESKSKWVFLFMNSVLLSAIVLGNVESVDISRFSSVMKEFGLRNIALGMVGVFLALFRKNKLRVLILPLFFSLLFVAFFRLTGLAVLSHPPRDLFFAGSLLFLFCASFFAFVKNWMIKHGKERMYYVFITLFFIVNVQALVVPSSFYSMVEPDFINGFLPATGGRIVAEPRASYALHYLGYDVVMAHPGLSEQGFKSVMLFLNDSCSDESFIIRHGVRWVYFENGCDEDLWLSMGDGWWLKK